MCRTLMFRIGLVLDTMLCYNQKCENNERRIMRANVIREIQIKRLYASWQRRKTGAETNNFRE